VILFIFTPVHEECCAVVINTLFCLKHKQDYNIIRG
jgi:hypothetical protein